MKTIFMGVLPVFAVFSALHVNAQVITTIAGSGIGSGFSGDGGPATNATIYQSNGIGIDSRGNLYIGSYGYYGASLYISKIRKVDTSGIISTFAGIDTCGYSGDGGPATAARLYLPKGITFDKKGNVYISDLGDGCVRKVAVNGIISTFAGNGSFTPSGDGGPATAAGLGGPVGLCMDKAGNLYIAAGNKIRKVDTNGIISTFAGTGVAGYGGDGGLAIAAKFAVPGQIALDVDGSMYIADEGNNRVRKINTEGTITTIAGNGIAGYSGNGGAATAAQLYNPTGVFPDNCGNIYISDSRNNVIRMVNGAGIIKGFAGNGYGAAGVVGSGAFSGDGGPAMAAELNFPGMVYLDKHENVYIYDSYNNRIRYIQMDSCRNTSDVPAVTASANNLKIWPNPSLDGAFTFNLSSKGKEEVSIVVTNIAGGNVKEMRAETNKDIEVNINALAGIYFLSASTANGKWVKKIVVE